MVTDARDWHGPGAAVQATHAEVGEYWAWVPAPLPPEIEYDAALATLIADAAGALGALAGTGRDLANPHVLLNPFLRREAVLSSRIEGTQATISDVYAYEAQLPLPGIGGGEGTPPPERHGDAWEVLNYVAALSEGIQMIQQYPASLALIQQLHARLMEGVRGREPTPGHFRQLQNVIGPEGATIRTATYIPPPPVHLMDTLREFEQYIRSADESMHRLLRLAVVHYQFEAIHPFNDGNGRVGRLLISLLSVSWGLLPLPLLYLSAYLERRRAEYYALLQGVTERGEWRDWIAFFLRGVTQQSADAATRAMRLHDVGVELQGRAVAAKAPGGAVALAGRLVERPILTINIAMSLIGGDVTYHNARRQVHRLVELGILEPYFSSGHQDYFVAKEVIRAVEEEAPQGE